MLDPSVKNEKDTIRYVKNYIIHYIIKSIEFSRF